MSQEKTTPAPWYFEVFDEDQLYKVRSKATGYPHTIATIIPDKNAKDNASLIASAPALKQENTALKEENERLHQAGKESLLLYNSMVGEISRYKDALEKIMLLYIPSHEVYISQQLHTARSIAKEALKK